MEEPKNIDRLYQEKFKDFEVFPEPIVWKNIEKNLMKKKKKRIVPLWLRLGSAAAILIGVTFTGIWYVNQPQPLNNTIEISNQNNERLDREKVISDEGNASLEAETQSSNPQKENIQLKASSTTVITNTPRALATNSAQEEGQSNRTDATEIDPLESQENTATRLAFVGTKTVDSTTRSSIDSERPEDEASSNLEGKKSLVEVVLAQADQESDLTEKLPAEPLSKWSIGSNVAPVFYNAIGKGSPIDPDLALNDKSANTGLSYGIKVNYKISDRFTLQSGLNTVELGYETHNAAALLSSSLVDGSNANINAELEGVGVDVVSTQQQNSETFSQRSLFDNSGKIDQSFNYLEFPVEAKYALVQKKLGINLVGGFSTYVLYQNNISVTSFGKTTSLGEASNINTVNFSGNVGLDLNFSLSKKLYLNTSPMLKYQFNTFSENSGGFKPYFFGVYAGLNFRF